MRDVLTRGGAYPRWPAAARARAPRCARRPDAWRAAASPGQDLGEDHTHDRVRAAADRAQARVAGHALDLVLLHVARAAVELQARVHDVEARALGGRSEANTTE